MSTGYKLTRSGLNEIKQIHDYITANPNSESIRSQPLYKRTAIAAAAQWSFDRDGKVYIQAAGYRQTYPTSWNYNSKAVLQAFERAFITQERAKASGILDDLDRRGRQETPKITAPITPITQGRFREVQPDIRTRVEDQSSRPGIGVDSIRQGLRSGARSPTENTLRMADPPSSRGSTSDMDPGNGEGSRPANEGSPYDTASVKELLKAIMSRIDGLENEIRAPRDSTPSENQQRLTTPRAEQVINPDRNWKLQDIGYFAPRKRKKENEDEPDEEFEDTGKVIMYRDIHTWIQRVLDITRTPERKELFRTEGWTLLREEANQWWHYQLSNVEKANAKATVDTFLDKLKQRFGIKPDVALEWLQKNKYTLAMNRKDDNIRDFAMRLFKYAKVYGDTSDSQMLTRLYGSLHPKLQQTTGKPRESTLTSEYLDLLEEQQQAIYRESRESGRGSGYLATSDDEDVYWNGGRPENGRQDTRGFPPREYRPFQNNQPRPYFRDTQRPFPQGGPSERREQYMGQRRNPPNFRGRGRPWTRQGQQRNRQNPRDRVRYWRYGKSEKGSDNRYYIVDEVVIREDNANIESEMRRLEDAHYVVLSDGLEYIDEEDDENDNDFYGYNYHTLGDQEEKVDQNQMPKNAEAYLLQDSQMSLSGNPPPNKDKFSLQKEWNQAPTPAAEKSDHPHANFVFEEGQVIEADPRPRRIGQVQDQSSYFRIGIKTKLSGNSEEVCLDTGSSGVLIGKDFLDRFVTNARFRDIDPIEVKGVGGTQKVTQVAMFDFFIEGEVGGKAVMGHFTIEAKVIDSLKPNMLIGTDFMMNHGITMDFSKLTCTFRSVFGMKVRGTAIKRHLVNSPMRRVMASKRTKIPAMSSMFIPVQYVDVPDTGNKEAYHFSGSLEGAVDATIDKDTPKMVMIRNDKAWPIKIEQGQKVGNIDRYTGHEVAHFVDWDNLDRLGTEALTQSSVETYLATVQAHDEDIGDGKASESDIGRVTAGSRVYPPSYGITKPDDVPHIKSSTGVSIANLNPLLAQKMKEVIDKYDTFRDKGIVPMAEEDKMRVDLVDGWQEQLKPVKFYPLGQQDSEFLYKTHDLLHSQGKMSFMNEPTPIACPAFVVWKMANNVKIKGRVVIDMRPLNRLMVPDVYPLPDQDDIMSAMVGKLYFTSLDATSFFFQLPVLTKHRNRMVIITPRGLERSNVALMGCRNSPAFAQRFMDRLFFDHRGFVRAYIDDIIIFSETAEEHLQHVEMVLSILDKARVHISAAKSFVSYPAVRLLGYVVDGSGVTKTEDRIDAFRKLEFPDTLADLETYLGMADWLRTGIAWYSVKSKPLQDRKTALLKELREAGGIAKGSSKNTRKSITSKVKFEPTKEEKDSWKQLQDHLCQQYTLYHHNPVKPLFVKVDACKGAIGCLIFQLNVDEWDEKSIPGKEISTSLVKPVMFLSRLTTPVERRYGSTEMEVAGLLWVCRKNRKLLHSNTNPVNVLTDHAATRQIVMHTSLHTMDLNKANPRLANAAIYLSQFQLRIFHIPGILNVVPDALSRLPTNLSDRSQAEASKASELDDIWEDTALWLNIDIGNEEPDKVTTTAVLNDEFKTRMVEGYTTDRRYKKVYDILTKRVKDGLKLGELTPSERKRLQRRGKLPAGPFELEDGLLYHVRHDGERAICLPDNCVKDVLELVHDRKHHFGWNRMLADLKDIHFRNKSRRCRMFTRFCETCRQNQVDRDPPYGELNPIITKPDPYQVIAMDFITDMPEVPKTQWLPFPLHEGFEVFNSLLTINCKGSRKTLLLPGNVKYQAKDWAKSILWSLHYADWGLPLQIISDRDPKFTSELWKEIFDLLEVKRLLSTSYHPQTDGLSERKNQTVEIAIRFHYAVNPDVPWVNVLPALQHHLNNSHSVTVGRSPNEMVLGFRPRSALDVVSARAGTTVSEEARAVLRGDYAQEAADLVDIAATMSKQRYDDKHTPVSFEEGDTVYLRLGKGYHLPGKPKLKWSAQRAGPFKVIEKVGPLAYKLNFPEAWRVHPVVSVAQLYKPYPGEDEFGRKQPEPQPVAVDGDEEEWEIERVVNRRIQWRGGRPSIQYLVRWKGFEAKDDEWRSAPELRLSAPKLVKEYENKNAIDWPKEFKVKGKAYKAGAEATAMRNVEALADA